MRWSRLFAAAILAVALVALTGCQMIAERAAQTALEKTTGVKVESSGDGVTVKTPGGEVSTSDAAKLPDDFPSTVPMYGNLKLGTVMTTGSAPSKSYIVSGTTTDDAKDVWTWWKKALEDGGWKITSSMEVGDSVGGLNATKDDLGVNLAIGHGADNVTQISLTVAPKKN